MKNISFIRNSDKLYRGFYAPVFECESVETELSLQAFVYESAETELSLRSFVYESAETELSLRAFMYESAETELSLQAFGSEYLPIKPYPNHSKSNF